MASTVAGSDHPLPRDDDDTPPSPPFDTLSHTPAAVPRAAIAVDTPSLPPVSRTPLPQPLDQPATGPAASNDQSSGPTTIDFETFNQILDLDEDDTHEFSKGMAWAYFSQAGTTFVEMDEAFTNKDLIKLSSLGHFLKGSSAALGVAKVQASCEKIQHYGQLRDEEANEDLTKETALAKIGPLLVKVQEEYVVAEKWLRDWYGTHGGNEDPIS